MTDVPVTDSATGVTSLYRRFRPGRFVELRGQDHVVRALQGAVRNDRVVHAYLFSGPRGTGKTTAARILAKALNCEHPLDGDACDQCASCVAITRGSSLDVTELDAASNNGVDDIREIIAGAWHGTPGRWKVYIFDEVHQLSKAASAALLKTLEEPPPHVVFVLATTDPHKVLPTIRSRTQHLEFRLIAGDTLNALLHDVRGAAGLAADDATIEAAVRLGRGSARDALSALDQLVATGSLREAQPGFDPLFAALADPDAVGALRALAVLTGEGWDPEQLAESFAAEVRQAFLLQVAPEVADAVDQDRERLAAWGARLGLARTVRVLETLGRSMREMKSAPEKVVILEVALVRLVHPDLDATVAALDERVTRLERVAPVPGAPAPTPPPLRPIGSTPSAAPTAPSPTPSPVVVPEEAPAPEVPAPPAAPATTLLGAEASALTLAEVRQRFAAGVIARTSRSAQMLLRGAEVRAITGQHLTIALPSDEACRSAQDYLGSLRGALEHEFRIALTVEFVADPALVAAPPPAKRTSPSTVRPAEPEHDEVDDDGAPAIVVDSVAGHLITEMFPGAEEIS